MRARGRPSNCGSPMAGRGGATRCQQRGPRARGDLRTRARSRLGAGRPSAPSGEPGMGAGVGGGTMSTLGSPVRAYDFLLKFLLVGDSDVGKGEILASLQDGAAESPYGHPAGERGARTGEQSPGSARWAAGSARGPGERATSGGGAPRRRGSARRARGASGGRGSARRAGGGVGWGRGLGGVRRAGEFRRYQGSAQRGRQLTGDPGSAQRARERTGERAVGREESGRRSALGLSKAQRARERKGGPGERAEGLGAHPGSGEGAAGQRAHGRPGGAHGGHGGAGRRHLGSAARSWGAGTGASPTRRREEKLWSKRTAADQGGRGSPPAPLRERGARLEGIPRCTPSSARGEHRASSLVSPRSASRGS